MNTGRNSFDLNASKHDPPYLVVGETRTTKTQNVIMVPDTETKTGYQNSTKSVTGNT